MRWSKEAREERALRRQMDAVDWVVQRASADIGSLTIFGRTKVADLPPAPPPFEVKRIGKFVPQVHLCLDGVALYHQHLTPEQMATCMKHLNALEDWAARVRVARKAYDAREEAAEEARWAKNRAADEERKRRYLEDVKGRL